MDWIGGSGVIVHSLHHNDANDQEINKKSLKTKVVETSKSKKWGVM